MASLKFFILAAVFACAYAAEEERVKKDVLLGTVPYAYSALPYAYAAYDDGKYYPGKYVAAAPAVAAYHAPVVPAVSTYSAAVPVSAYSAYPYTYPYVKSFVY
uniref:Uncharacterized protein n=1 Tax=Rhodnius prolixus TaxID=13249 RepID=T1HX31_RHOPR